jgi:RimJ/RimL family protein N-acetyltransferase
VTGRRLARLHTPRLVLEPLPAELARRMLSGELDTARPADGWPHEDSFVVLRMTVDAGWPTWLVRLREPTDHPAAGRVIGECGLKGWPDGSGTVEIGYGLATPYRGQGFGTELVGEVVRWLPAAGARRVLAEVAVGNVASRRLVERLGFTVDRCVGGFVYYLLPVSAAAS